MGSHLLTWTSILRRFLSSLFFTDKSCRSGAVFNFSPSLMWLGMILPSLWFMEPSTTKRPDIALKLITRWILRKFKYKIPRSLYTMETLSTPGSSSVFPPIKYSYLFLLQVIIVLLSLSSYTSYDPSAASFSPHI